MERACRSVDTAIIFDASDSLFTTVALTTPASDHDLPFTAVTRDSFVCEPSEQAPQNMVIRCANPSCDFTRDRALPVLSVDEAIYRRLPAFLIATVDKFAGLPWIGEAGAFFDHVDRHNQWGFYGAAEPNVGRPLWNGNSFAPPDLIVSVVR